MHQEQEEEFVLIFPSLMGKIIFIFWTLSDMNGKVFFLCVFSMSTVTSEAGGAGFDSTPGCSSFLQHF